jgi:phospholipid/cholesterol/gamma-HCH transport system substrate-binding protein
MDESRIELKVGALVVAAVAGVVALLVSMGELSLAAGTSLSVEFGHTGNVVKSAPVKLAGVPVGKVERISLAPTRHGADGEALPVTMTISVDPEVVKALRADAKVTVSSQGPLGESYLELWAGSAAAPLDPARPLRGTDAPRLDVVSNRLAQFLESASKVLENDPDALIKMVRGVSNLSTTVDGVVTENRDTVRALASELAATAKDLRVLAANARTQLEPGGRANALLDDAAATARATRNDWPALSKQASVALTGLAAVAGPLTAEDGQHLKSTIARYQSAGEKLDGLAGRADRLLGRLEAGDGTLGALMKDKQAYDDLKDLLADLRKHPWKMLWKD